MFKKKEEVQEYIKSENVEIIDFKIVDMVGKWHHLSITKEKYDEEIYKKGIGFDGSSYGFKSVEKSDMVFIPDIRTAFIDPFAKVKTLVMICNMYTIEKTGLKRYEDDPRYIVEKTKKLLKEKGIADQCELGPEFEFYVLDHISVKNENGNMYVNIDSKQSPWNLEKTQEDNLGIVTPKEGAYHLDKPFDTSSDFRDEVSLLLEKANIPIKYHHSENGSPGQVEVEVDFADIEQMADRTMIIKYFLRNQAYKEGKTITFMPKPFSFEAGNGFHIHFKMKKEGKYIFYKEGGYSDLSDTALYAIGGILKHAPAIMPFSNQSTNSYKRLVPGYEAPVSVCYATANRSAVIRIPGYAVDEDEKRFEVRSPDAMCNPYLTYAAFLLAMIDGIENKIDPEKQGYGPYDVNLYDLDEEEQKKIKSLPTNLIEASQELIKDKDFLTKDKVFSDNLINNQIKRIKEEHNYISKLPHPEEFKLYYNN
jgi:glutamine synthetase